MRSNAAYDGRAAQELYGAGAATLVELTQALVSYYSGELDPERFTLGA